MMSKQPTHKFSLPNSNVRPETTTHWNEYTHEIEIPLKNDGTLGFTVEGGSDNGEFAYFGDINEESHTENQGYEKSDIILEIQGQKVAGYTQRDVIAWLNHCTRNGNPIIIKAIKAGYQTPDLRQYLNTRFKKGSLDHDLQNTIRDNLYLRTVPCTTRTPREGEINGVDYTFLTPEEFLALEKSGNLLESGLYEGNHYGTPKPPRLTPPRRSPLEDEFLPGGHPSSEGKRRRNRSNVEAMASKSAELDSFNSKKQAHPGIRDLGPLPENWEQSFTENGEPYYIDHRAGTSQWADPRLSKQNSISEELPYGWEKIEDPHYGTYYIDHINKRTQYENPLLNNSQMQLNGEDQEGATSSTLSTTLPMLPTPPMPEPTPPPVPANGSAVKQPPSECYPSPELTSRFPYCIPCLDQPTPQPAGDSKPPPCQFTRNPEELKGELIETNIVKSARGFGFTIVGGDEGATTDEFLQIKSLVPHGPAWQDGKLRTGDVLVYVNDLCVLGYSHQEIVSLFQSLSPGVSTYLKVCRGYQLPFDPNDPNTEIVTTMAVASSNVDPRGEIITVEMIKGSEGFGFTIADSAYGQKVKKILDRPRCELLLLGDILLEVNNQQVRTMAHADVVKLLKNCPTGQPSILVLQRGGVLTPVRPKNRTPKSSNTTPKSIHDSYVGRPNGATVPGTFRSKTPTADLYSSMPKEKDTIQRPKTPLVDTRNWGEPNLNTSIRSQGPLDQLDNSFPESSSSVLLSPQGHLADSDQPYYGFKKEFAVSPTTSHHRPPTDFKSMSLSPLSRSLDPYICPDLLRPEPLDPIDHRRRTPLHNLSHSGGFYDYRWSDMGQYYPPYEARRSYHYDPRRRQYPMSFDSDFSMPSNVPPKYLVTTITLQRHENGFGFRIVGGTEEGSQVSIGHIVRAGAADVDGRLQTGDEILSIDGHPVLNYSHHHAVQLMGQAANRGQVTLTVRRATADWRSPSIVYPYDVVVNRREDEGFGFVIISSVTRSGSTIGRIIESSPAERCGQLHVGDRILAVNGISILNMPHGDIVNLIKDSGYSVTLTIGPSNDDLSSQASTSQRGEDASTEEQYFVIELKKGPRGFGFSIRGGYEFQQMPLFVLRIAERGPADQPNSIHVGDQILEINGLSTKNMTHQEAIQLIRLSGQIVRLLVKRTKIEINNSFSRLAVAPDPLSQASNNGENT